MINTYIGVKSVYCATDTYDQTMNVKMPGKEDMFCPASEHTPVIFALWMLRLVDKLEIGLGVTQGI